MPLVFTIGFCFLSYELFFHIFLAYSTFRNQSPNRGQKARDFGCLDSRHDQKRLFQGDGEKWNFEEVNFLSLEIVDDDSCVMTRSEIPDMLLFFSLSMLFHEKKLPEGRVWSWGTTNIVLLCR